MHYQFLIYVISAAVAGGAVLFFYPQATEDNQISRILGAFSLSTLVAQVCAVWMLFASLRAFKHQLRVAYYLLIIGILTYSLFLLPSIFLIFGINVATEIQPMLTLVPYMFGAVIIYASIRKFAKQLGATSIWSKFWFVVSLSAILYAVTGLTARSPLPDIPQEMYSLLIGFFGWSAGFTIAATVLAVQIRRLLGDDYKKAMLWLLLALGALAVGSIHQVIITNQGFVYADGLWYLAYSFWPHLLTGILLLKAALSFRALSGKRGTLPDNASYFDVISYVAQMVSNPAAIDVVLDKFREITSRGSTSLSASDKIALFGVYMAIEDHLTTKDPLIKITREELRMRLPDRFQQELTRYKK